MSQLLINQDEMLLSTIRIHGRPVKRIKQAMQSGISPEQAIQEMLELASAAFEFAVNGSTVEQLAISADSIIHKIVHQTENIYPTELKAVTGEILRNSFEGFENTVRAELKSQRDILKEAIQNLGISRELYKRSPGKGSAHQERVGRYLEILCGTDLVEDVSRSRTGKSHSQRKINSGDFLVSSKERTDGVARPLFVVEAKDSKLSLSEALRELNENKRNRNVPVGILVFASMDQAPTNGKQFKVVPGNNIIAVLDDASDAPIAAAYSYAKHLALGMIEEKSLDVAKLKDVIAEIERSLDFEVKINKETGIASGALTRLAEIALQAKEDVICAIAKLSSNHTELRKS